MRSRAFIAISLLLAAFPVRLAACGPWWYPPQEYTLYRASSHYLSDYHYYPTFQLDDRDNCEIWKRETGSKAELNDIYHIVYKASIEDLQDLQKKGKKSALYSSNAFARTLNQNREALEFLLLAKLCEKTREQMSDPWYYPAKKDIQRTSLETVIARSTEAISSGSKLWKRYALQATRAMLSLGQYPECIALWKSLPQSEPDIIYLLTVRNVAGAYYHTGDLSTANQLFGRCGDASSMLLCSNGDRRSYIESLYELCPDSPDLRGVVETNVGNGVYDICLKIAQEGKVKDLDFWYYTAAYIEYTNGKKALALKHAKAAEKSPGSAYIKESAHVLTIMIEAETLPLNSGYETAMLEHVKWLDGKLVEHLDEKVKYDTSHEGIYRMAINMSFYYWNDMLRRLVHGCVNPRLVSAHREEAALAFANMADNRLLGLVNEVVVERSGADWQKPPYVLTMDEYRSGDFFNYHDYSNAFFELIDSTATYKVIKYVESLDDPSSAFRFLNERSYTDRDYLWDIIGTKYLRECRYDQAERWLSRVSPDYQKRLNTKDYMRLDPFTFKEEYLKDTDNYKCRFAKEMAQLSRSPRGLTKGEQVEGASLDLAKMAVGMRNSVDRCWALTFYHKMWQDADSTSPNHYYKAREKVLSTIPGLHARALTRTKSREEKASIELMFGNLAQVMRYPGTAAAESIRGRCDNYYDYHLDSRDTYGKWWIDYEGNHWVRQPGDPYD